MKIEGGLWKSSFQDKIKKIDVIDRIDF